MRISKFFARISFLLCAFALMASLSFASPHNKGKPESKYSYSVVIAHDQMVSAIVQTIAEISISRPSDAALQHQKFTIPPRAGRTIQISQSSRQEINLRDLERPRIRSPSRQLVFYPA